MTTRREDERAAHGPRGDLLLAVGEGRLLSCPIDRPEISIGRDPGCTFVIDHPSLSRRHAVVRFDSQPTIQDLGSTNGVWLDGQCIRGGDPTPIPVRGNFQIGPFSFVIVARSHASQVSAGGRHQLRVEDPTLAGLPSLVREFAGTQTNILIMGETGVGKEVLAASLHAASERSGPLVQLNCAALSETLLENELFGHERGAFTGATTRSEGLIESAHGGTVMLDEIGEMPLATQAKLLRVIERREVTRLGATRAVSVDVRFLAATNRDLVAEVAAKKFREDLYFRLDGVTLVIPPLRERKALIVPLAMSFLPRSDTGSQPELRADVVEALLAYPWPGNVRELKAVIERAAVMARGAPISPRHLLFRASPTPVVPDEPAAQPEALDPEDAADRARVVRALEECGGNQSRAAKLLGISRTTLITKLRIYKIKRPLLKRGS